MNQSIPGATTIIAPLEVRNNPDLPVTDTRHVQGGGWSQPDVASRDQIPMALRLADVTTCYVAATDKTYVLRGGIANANWKEVSTTGPGAGSGKLINRFLDRLNMVVGVAIDVTIPVDLFGPNVTGYTSLTAQGLPDGVTLNEQFHLVGTPTGEGKSLFLLNAVVNSGEHLQYVAAYAVAGAAVPSVSSVGAALIDVSFGAMNPQDTTQLVYDFDLALVLNEPGLVETGQRATPGVSTRFIGDASVVSCLAIAAVSKQVVPDKPLLRFYRFGISVARLRTLYPAQQTVRFDMRGKRKATNPDGLGNGVIFRVGRDRTSGLQSAAQPIGFATANPTAAGPPQDYTNSGNQWGVPAVDVTLAHFTVNLSDGGVEFVPHVGPPTPALDATSLSLTRTADGFTANWSEVTGANGYEMQYDTDPAAAANGVSVAGLTKSVTGLSVGVAQYVRVRPLADNAVKGPWSNTLSVTPGGSGETVDATNAEYGTTLAGFMGGAIQSVDFTRDGSSLDTSIFYTAADPSAAFQVKLVRVDGNPFSGTGFQSNTYRMSEVAGNLPYSIAPATGVIRFNRGSGNGLTAGDYYLFFKPWETNDKPVRLSLTLGDSALTRQNVAKLSAAPAPDPAPDTGNSSTTGYDAGSADSVSGLTDPDGVASENSMASPNPEN